MTQEAQIQIDNEQDDISLLDLMHTVAANWRLLVLGPLFVGLLALGVTFLIPPTFTATTKFLPPPQQQNSAAVMLQSLGSLGGLAGATSGLKNPGDQYVAFLKSRSVQDALIDRLQLQTHYGVKLKDDAINALNSNIRINNGKDGLIVIEVDDEDPVFAAKLANANIEELGKLLDRLAVTEAQQRRQFFEKQLQQTKIKLTAAEQALKTTGLNASTMKTNPTTAVAAVAQLQAQITAQEVKLASMRGYLTESAPTVKQAKTELAALQEQAARIANTSEQTDTGDADYIARYREMKYQETLFELFARQFELAKVDESREGSVIQVLDVAQTPERKSKPKRSIVAISSTLGTAFLLLVFVFIRQALHDQSKNPVTAEKINRLRTALRA